MVRWGSKLLGVFRGKTRKGRDRRRLFLERLEGRRVLTASSLVFDPPTDGVADNYTLRLQDTQVQIVDTVSQAVLASASAGSIDTVLINGSGDDDSLTVDLAGGNPIPTGGVTYHGNEQATAKPGDVLSVITPNFGDLTYSVTGLGAGEVLLGGESLIRFTGLEPMTFVGAGGTLTLDGTSQPAIDTLTVSDAGGPADGVNIVTGNGGFEDTTFSGFDSVIVLGGDGAEDFLLTGLDDAASGTGVALTSVTLDGSNLSATDNSPDTITINSLPSTISLTARGGGGDDQLRIGSGVQGSVIVEGGDGDDTVTIDADASASSVMVDGGANGGPGDTLVYEGTGTNNVTGGGAGNITGSGVTVDYIGIEDVQFVVGETLTIHLEGFIENAGLVLENPTTGKLFDLDNPTNPDTTMLFSAQDQLIVEGSAADNLLTVDYSAGDPLSLLTFGLQFNGAAGNDGLAVIGDGNTAIYTPDATTTGNGTVDIDSRTITFTGLEPVDISGMVTATVALPGLDDVLTVTNGFDFATGLIPAIVVEGTSGGVPIEAAHLFSNTTVLIDTDAVMPGDDTITVTSASNAHANTNLTIDTGSGADSVDLGAVTLAGALTVDTVTLTDAVGSAIAVTDLGDLGGSSITLGDSVGDSVAFGTLTFNSPGAVTIVEADATVLSGTSTASTLTLSATVGSITDDGTADLTVTGNANFDSVDDSAITLDDAYAFGSLTFDGGAVTIAETDGTVLRDMNSATSLDLDSGGTIADAVGAMLTVTGNADFAGTAIMLNNAAAHAFDTLTFNSVGPVLIVEADATVLSGTSTASTLTLSATVGSITDDGTADLTVTGNANFDSVDDSAITLDDAYAFGSLTFDGGTVTIAETDGTVLRDVSSATSLDLDSGGTIADAVGAMLTVTGNADFAGTAIMLNNAAAHAFDTLTFNSVGPVLIVEADATVLSGTSTASTLTLSAMVGSITDDGTADLTVTGNANFDSVDDSAITLDDTYAFGSLTFDGGGVTIVETDGTVLSGSNTATSLNLDSGGTIVDAAAATLTVMGNADFAGTAIVLNNAAAHAFDTLTFNSPGAVVIMEADATVLSGLSTASVLVLSAMVGSITDDGTVDLTVTGNANFDSVDDSAITLDDVYAFGNLTFDGGVVTIVETDGTVLSGSNTATSLNLDSGGTIVDAVGATLTIMGNADFAGTAIVLNNAAVHVFDTLTFNSPGAVIIMEADATVLSGLSTASVLVLSAAVGSITDDGTANLTVTGNANFDSVDDSAITLDDTYAFGSLTFDGGVVTIAETDGTVLSGSNTATSLNLDSGGTIVDAVGATLTVMGNADFAGTAIVLNNAAAHAFDTLTFNSPGAVIIMEADATVLSGLSTASVLVLSAAVGSITDDGTADLTVTGNANFDSVDDSAITLDDTYAFGSLTFDGGVVTIVEADDTILSGPNTATSLDLDSGGTILDAVGATLTVMGNADFAGTAIVLNNAAAHAFDTLTFNSPGAVIIMEADATVLSGLSTASTLALTAAVGSITDDGTADLTVTGNANFDSVDDSAITLDDTYAFGSLTFDGGAVTIVETDGTALRDMNSAASLDLDSGGAITDIAGTLLDVTTGLADFAGGAIVLGDNGGDTVNFGSLTFISTAAVNITEDSSMLVTGASLATGSIVLATTDTAAATDDFALDAAASLSSTVGSIQLDVGDDVDIPVGTSVMAAGTLSINVDAPGTDADAATGSTVDLNGTITSAATAITGGDDNDTFNLATVPGTLAGITGNVTVAGGGNGPGTRDVATGVDVGHPFGCPAMPTPLAMLPPASVATGDTLTISDASEVTAHTYAIDGDSVTRDGGLSIGYSAIEELELFAGSANDTAEVDMAAAGALPSVVAFDGGGDVPAPINGGDMFKVFGTAGDDNMIVGVITADPGPRSPFEVADVEFIKARGLDGDDDIVNDTAARSLLEGMGGNDTLVGGSSIDILVGGGGLDYLDGRGGNDFLFADVNLLTTTSGEIIDDDPVGQGDFIRGGAGSNTAAQIGPCDSIVSINTRLLDGGGQKDVLTWLQAQITPLTLDSLDDVITTAFTQLGFDWGLQAQTSLTGATVSAAFSAAVSSESGVPDQEAVASAAPLEASGIGPATQAANDSDDAAASRLTPSSITPISEPGVAEGRDDNAAAKLVPPQAQGPSQEVGPDGDSEANVLPSQLAQPEHDCPYHDNWGGRGEKWIQDVNQQWYFILPNGEMYLADTNVQATGTNVANVGPAAHADPSILFDDSDGGVGEGEAILADLVFANHIDDLSPPLLDRIQPWRNPVDAFDVDQNGYRTAVDALIIINEINRRAKSGEPTSLDNPGEHAPTSFFDANNDNHVSAADVLQIINAVNEQTSPSV